MGQECEEPQHCEKCRKRIHHNRYGLCMACRKHPCSDCGRIHTSPKRRCADCWQKVMRDVDPYSADGKWCGTRGREE